jgi:hypothetical protein
MKGMKAKDRMKAKDKRQKAKGKSENRCGPRLQRSLSSFAKTPNLCSSAPPSELLPFAFCLLPFAFPEGPLGLS